MTRMTSLEYTLSLFLDLVIEYHLPSIHLLYRVFHVKLTLDQLKVLVSLRRTG